MNIQLENGINSLIAYYFKETNFKFLDEYDLKILVNLANMCGIQINIDDSKESITNIYSQFLSELDQLIEGTWCKGIVATANSSSTIWTNEKRDFERVYRLQINDRFMRKNLTIEGQQELQIVPELDDFFNKMIGVDIEILLSRMPNSDLLKKYMTLKKVILCKTPDNEYFYENIPSDILYNSFDDWSINEQDRGIYLETYKFIESLEQKIIWDAGQKINSCVSEKSCKLLQHPLH